MNPETLVVSVVVAVAAGLVGCFAVMRRMALAADALSHVALPGIGIAIALQIHPVYGAAAMLFFGALLVWALERRTRAATEAVLGVVFSAALAIGSLMTTDEELIHALIGQPEALTAAETVVVFAAACVVVWFIVARRHHLLIMLVSPEVARTAGINVRRLNLMFLEVFALAIALGLRYLGVLLVGALIIIPAVIAKRLARGVQTMLVISAVIAVISTVGGMWLAQLLHRESGPLIVIVAASAFLLGLLKPSRSGAA